MKAIIRKDLQAEGLNIPTSSGGFLSGSEPFPAKWVGDSLWVHDGVQWVEVESIDFDFIDERTSKMNKNDLISKVIEVIRQDIKDGDVTAIWEMLSAVNEEVLINYLPEKP